MRARTPRSWNGFSISSVETSANLRATWKNTDKGAFSAAQALARRLYRQGRCQTGSSTRTSCSRARTGSRRPSPARPRWQAERNVVLREDTTQGGHFRNSCRVGPGRHLPGPPTDPDVQISRIRLFGSWTHWRWRTECTTRAGGSGKLSSSHARRSAIEPSRWERRFNHLPQIRWAS